ncbi:hypothetical protein [Luteitalea pratensis]|nr:hypothetical protein [Luteitalea pratensis]
MVRHAHLGQLGDDGVAQIVEPEAWQARGVAQRRAVSHFNIGLVAS